MKPNTPPIAPAATPTSLPVLTARTPVYDSITSGSQELIHIYSLQAALCVTRHKLLLYTRLTESVHCFNAQPALLRVCTVELQESNVFLYFYVATVLHNI
jgi:hypothetical protein